MTTKRAVMRAAAERSAGRPLESYPIRLFAEHMAEIFGVSLKRFYAQDRVGDYDFAVNKPSIGRKSWSRDRVRRYFDGTLKGLTDRSHLKAVI